MLRATSAIQVSGLLRRNESYRRKFKTYDQKQSRNHHGRIVRHRRIHGEAACEQGRQSRAGRAARRTDRIASIVAFAIDQPDDTTVNEFTVGPANQPW
jgi:NADP-dependent 3-hydroxy acid dehydrogenase YdfG